MENNNQQQQEVIAIHDIYNDEYWLKTYGVSTEELNETGDISISEKIIQANTKNHNFTN